MYAGLVDVPPDVIASRHHVLAHSLAPRFADNAPLANCGAINRLFWLVAKMVMTGANIVVEDFLLFRRQGRVKGLHCGQTCA